jgi:opacity protein-like surface antigen
MFYCGLSYGAALSGAGTRDTLIEAEYLDFLSIGVDYQYQNRDVSTSSEGKMRLKSQTVDGFIGVDPYKWLLIYATFGGSSAKTGDVNSFNDPRFKWSAGFDVNWWRYKVTMPEFLEGGLSLKTHAEFEMHYSGADAERIKWNEYFLSLLVNYEVFSVSHDDMSKYPYSLMLFVGPALSWLEGYYYQTSYRQVDFHEAHLFGVVGGAELFIADNLSLGGAVQYYDAVSLSADVRYHF